MADHTRPLTVEELRRAIRNKERELSELDLMLADYHDEHSGLIHELRLLHALLREALETASKLPDRSLEDWKQT